MSIWFKPVDIDHLNAVSTDCANGQLGIEVLHARDDALEGRMPIDIRTRQPMGRLHGGASALFAETLASMAGGEVIDAERYFCVGLEINANHVRGATAGYVYGRATPLHIGRSHHVWNVTIEDENNRLVCVSRVTLAVLDKAGRT